MLLTAGPTFEAIDPVRGITNASSGKMGFALAQAAAEAGASGDRGRRTDVAADTRRRDANRRDERRADGRRGARACRRVRHLHRRRRGRRLHARLDRSAQKIKKSADSLTIALKPTVDILATVAARPNPPFCVGFAAESHDVARLAEEKRRRKRLAADRRESAHRTRWAATRTR